MDTPQVGNFNDQNWGISVIAVSRPERQRMPCLLGTTEQMRLVAEGMVRKRLRYADLSGDAGAGQRGIPAGDPF